MIIKPLLSSVVAAMALHAALVRADSQEFSFGVIGHAFRQAADEALLRHAIADSDADNLGFVVVDGIKSAGEPCSDAIYDRRRALLMKARNGIVLSLAGSDWADCKRDNGRSAAMERLTRVRDVYFQDEFSFGDSKIMLTRQSSSTKFRRYAENARWEMGDIAFATLNLPAANNHYLTDAGRNGEFEDRLIASRYWIKRVFTAAVRQRMPGIVLFCDGNPMVAPQNVRRDGFLEIRREIQSQAARYRGKVLLIHGQGENSASQGISWHGNIGTLAVGPGWAKVSVDSSSPTVFRLSPVLPLRGAR
jgi:hypothetical protein